MEKEKQKTICYTVEREFLGKITVTELVCRIIQSHIKNNVENEETPHMKKSFVYGKIDTRKAVER